MIEFLDSNICCLKLTTTTTELLYDFSNTLSQGEAHDAVVILDKVNLKEIFGTLKTLLATQKKNWKATGYRSRTRRNPRISRILGCGTYQN